MGRIEIENLSRRFAKTVAVDRVSLTIDDGEFLVLLGPSGCGKSTLLRMLAGLLPATSGRIRVDDRDVTAEPARGRDLAMVFQSYALYPHLTVAQNLAFPLRARRRPRNEIRDRVQRTAESLDIAHLLERRPKELSGGQRQRVAVGRALVRDPRAFLMDEPLSNLDAKLRTATRHELVSLHRRLGATFVYVTHDQVEAMTMATRIAVLNAGRVEQVGTPDEIYHRPTSVFVAGFIGSPPMNLLPATVTSHAGSVRVEGNSFGGTVRAGESPELFVTLGVRPEHLHVGPLPAGAEGIALDATVSSIEKLGHETLVLASVGDRPVALRTRPGTQFDEGTPLALHALATDTHLFDAATGIRLEWVDDDVEARQLTTALS
ncbi:ABC transporter ATP-binding protein [Salinibacterium sp. GXW1014]|uniref:ABC transporter ATP-binding protein n=1 Tax=Salinibacterium sp. GXW1014 TaxID=3377838 RepID=UPI00383B8C8F